MRKLIVLFFLIPSFSWSNVVILNCTPKEYKMFDGIIFTEKNLTEEDLNTISFIMRINKPMKYVELETTSGFKRKFRISQYGSLWIVYKRFQTSKFMLNSVIRFREKLNTVMFYFTTICWVCSNDVFF